MELPTDVKESLLKFGASEPCRYSGNILEYIDSIALMLAENVDQGLDLCFIRLPDFGDGKTLAVVGNTPNSEQITRILSAAWNYLHEVAQNGH